LNVPSRSSLRLRAVLPSNPLSAPRYWGNSTAFRTTLPSVGLVTVSRAHRYLSVPDSPVTTSGSCAARCPAATDHNKGR
jgi:hypothetical protein